MTIPTPAQVRDWLHHLPDLCALLGDALVTRSAEQHTSRPVPGSKPPVRLDIIGLLDERDVDWEAGMWRVDPDGHGVLPWLWGWCRDIEADAYQLRPTLCDEVPDPPTVAGCCAWLMQDDLLDWCAATLRQWDEFAIDLGRVVAAVRNATANVAEQRERPVECPRCGFALHRVKPDLWECSEGHALAVHAVTLREAAAILRRTDGNRAPTVRTLQRWANRPGLLTPVIDGPRSRLYDLGQIRAVLADTRLREGA